MARLSQDYKGGLWHFYELSNGGFYLAPNKTERMRVEVDGNGFDGAMSADAAGIVATLFALNHLVALVYEEGGPELDKLSDHYYFLRDFALGHPEAVTILRAID